MRKLTTAILLFLCTISYGQFGVLVGNFDSEIEIPTDSLVGYYPFSGNANDESGNGYDGIVTDAVLDTNRFGEIDSAYYFDGDGDFIEFQDGTGFSLDSFCLSIWAKFDASGVTNYLFWKRDGPGDHYGLVKNSGENIVAYYNSQSFNTNPVGIPAPGNWVHLVYQVTSDSIYVYIDNTLAGSTELTSSGIDVTTNAVAGTLSPTELTLEMQGNIDDIRIYSRPLTEDEIEAIYIEGGWPNP